MRAASVLVLVGDTGDLLMKVEKKAKALAPGTEAVRLHIHTHTHTTLAWLTSFTREIWPGMI